MIERRSLLGGMAALGLLASLAAPGQPPRGRFRIGVLAIGTPEGATAVTDAFNQAMRELGYVEGTNVVYEYRGAPVHQTACRASPTSSFKRFHPGD